VHQCAFDQIIEKFATHREPLQRLKSGYDSIIAELREFLNRDRRATVTPPETVQTFVGRKTGEKEKALRETLSKLHELIPSLNREIEGLKNECIQEKQKAQQKTEDERTVRMLLEESKVALMKMRSTMAKCEAEYQDAAAELEATEAKYKAAQKQMLESLESVFQLGCDVTETKRKIVELEQKEVELGQIERESHAEACESVRVEITQLREEADGQEKEIARLERAIGKIRHLSLA
jgi:chromosome segregation ATPase